MAQLTAPTITATLINGIDIQISGISSPNASGFKVRWGTLSGYGREDAITPTDGSYTLDDTFARTTYYVAVQAVGDGVDYEDSDWSNEVTVVTEGEEYSSITVKTLNGYASGKHAVQLSFQGADKKECYRYQIATTEAGVSSASPKVISLGSVNTCQETLNIYAGSLTPGQTYYFRYCVVRGKTCSAWSNIANVTLGSYTNTAVVTNTNDSGEGSLRAATATDTWVTFDPSLDGQTIILQSAYAGHNAYFDASALPHGIKIDASGVTTNQIFGTWNNVEFYGVTSASTSGVFGGEYIDCVFNNCSVTNVDNTHSLFNRQVKVFGCVLKGCTSNRYLIMYNYLYDCVIDNCTGSLLCGNAHIVNSYITNTTGFSIGNSAKFGGCVIQYNTSSSGKLFTTNSYLGECHVVNNTGPANDALAMGYFYWCRFIGNTVKTGSHGILDCTECYDTTIAETSGSSASSYGIWGGTYVRCKIMAKAPNYRAWIVAYTATLIDCLVWGQALDATFKNCTVRRLADGGYSGTFYNCLITRQDNTSSVSGANNIIVDETDPSSANYVGKIFVDYANGDYRLKPGSPAINAGDDQYVTTGDLDLAGNARINGSAVDVGAYEFYSSQLDPPTFTVTPGAGGTGSVAFELPEGGVSFLLESAADSTFTNPTQYTGTTSPLAISGLSGTVFFRAKTIGATSDENSDWSAVTSVFFDVIPPTVTPNINPVTGDTIWRIQPTYYLPNSITIDYLFTISDDTDPSPSYHWYIYDPNNTLIDDGTGNLPNQMLPEGKSCRVQVVVTDSAGNSSSASCTLAATFAKPTFTYSAGPGGTLTINYTLPTGADGADVRYRASGGSWSTETGVNNPCVITGLDGTYDFQLRATKSTDVWVYSGWTTIQTATLDAYPPVLTVPETAVDMTAGASVDLMTGVSAVDNQDPAPTIHYTITDAQGQTVVIGGQTQDLATADLSPGVYTIIYAASDATGNVATAERPLKVRLAAPTFEITTGAGGTATLAYTLPEGAVGCDILPLSSESFNPPVWIEGAENPCILSGLNGPYYFYFKATSPGGQYNSNNVRSSLYWLDAITPTVTVADKTRLEYVVGDTTVNLLAGVTATDDHDASVPLVYYLQNANNEIVEVDGARNNIPSEDVPIGGYKIVYEATDSVGNKGYNDRPLLVLPTVLETPTIACVGLFNTTATIGGLTVENAYGYAIEVDGAVIAEIDPPTSGTYAIANLTDNASHTIRVKALGDWEEPVGHYRDSGWSNSVTVIIGNPAEDNAPVISREQVTDRSITIGVSHYESSAGYFEILIAEDKAFSSPMTLTKVPADTIKISGLKASTIYYLKLRAVFSESTTPWSNVLLFQTQDLGPITPGDKLLYLRERIGLLRAYLADISNIDSVSIDGISESKYDREKLLKELADLEAEEARLVNGGGRLRTMNIRWTIR